MKNVVITGSTRGIGRGLAAEFLRQGCRVVISGRQQDAVDTAVAELEAGFDSAEVIGQACDVADAGQLQQLWDFAVAQFGRVDLWINNAGVSIARKPLAEQTPADLLRIVQTNLTAVLLANQLCIREMQVQQGGGQIWNMEGFGSNNATQPGMAAYGATKRAVTYLVKSLQKEVKGTAVQVNALSPGIVVTDLLLNDYDQSSEQWHKARKIFNILGDRVETVTPWLVQQMLKEGRTGRQVAWLTPAKAFARFSMAGFRKRELLPESP